MRLLPFLGLASLLVPACASSDPPSEVVGTKTDALTTLLPLAGCGEVESYLRERLSATVNRQVDDAIAQLDQTDYCYERNYGSDGASSANAGAAPQADGSSGGAKSTSTTNNQVTGVDEADFVKNDSKYLYLAANGAFRIVEAYPATNAREIANVKLDGEPKKLFVEGDRALVYVSVPQTTSTSADAVAYWRGNTECTYGYDCVPTGDGTRTKLEIFDIANRAAPRKVREIELSGSLLAARRIGNAVHTVVVDDRAAAIDLASYPDFSNVQSSCSGPNKMIAKMQRRAAWEKLRSDNLAKIAKADVLAMLPTATENGAPAAPACSGYFRPSLGESTSFTSIVSLDMAAGGAPTTATVVSDPGVVYASATGLYMSVPHDRSRSYGWYSGMEGQEQASLVHAFRIGEAPSLTAYAASGIVEGRVLNQFALDEYEGHLRIATTNGRVPDPKVHSVMTVLEQRGNALAITGKVDDIAPGEDIRSVRFEGARGYAVTFKKTDPLYVFDLGNAGAPKITGELKIPGFSTYMHMLDASHLLTIGYDADDQGSFAWFAGVMLQIFDVSDMKNPKLAHKHVIGTRGSSSEALTNHLAFTYYAPKNILALPMSICEGGSGGGYGSDLTFNGLMVFDVSTETGFAEHGRVSHPNTPSGSGYDSGACSNWWTNASSEVKRSVVMDSTVYSISTSRVKANDLGALSIDIANVSLAN